MLIQRPRSRTRITKQGISLATATQRMTSVKAGEVNAMASVLSSLKEPISDGVTLRSHVLTRPGARRALMKKNIKRQSKEHERRKANKQRQRIHNKTRRALARVYERVLTELRRRFVHIITLNHQEKPTVYVKRGKDLEVMTGVDAPSNDTLTATNMETVETQAIAADDARSRSLKTEILKEINNIVVDNVSSSQVVRRKEKSVAIAAVEEVVDMISPEKTEERTAHVVVHIGSASMEKRYLAHQSILLPPLRCCGGHGESHGQKGLYSDVLDESVLLPNLKKPISDGIEFEHPHVLTRPGARKAYMKKTIKRQSKEHERRKSNKQRQRLHKKTRRAFKRIYREVLTELRRHFVQIMTLRHQEKPTENVKLDKDPKVMARVNAPSNAIMAVAKMETAETQAFAADNDRSRSLKTEILKEVNTMVIDSVASSQVVRRKEESMIIATKAEVVDIISQKNSERRTAHVVGHLSSAPMKHRGLVEQSTRLRPLQSCGEQGGSHRQREQCSDIANASFLLQELRGVPLSLGEAPVWGSEVSRAGEEFAVICGFSAALGPLLSNRALDVVYGRKIFPNVESLPQVHVTYMFHIYWQDEVAPFDASERFSRMVKGTKTGMITKLELQPFILAMAQRHPDLRSLSPDEVSQYVHTVLGIVFYKLSPCGVIRPKDLTGSAFVASFNAVGRQEESLEESEYFSLSHHHKIFTHFWALSGDGWGVGYDALRKYRHGCESGIAVGSVRAKRVIDAGRRDVVRDVSAGDTKFRDAGYGKALDYDAFVGFFVCEEALRAGTCSDSDVRYCFEIVDDRGEGRLDLAGMKKIYNDMICEWMGMCVINDKFRTIEDIVSQYMDGMGIEPGRSDVTLAELLKPANIQRAGCLFEEIFTGANLEPEGFMQHSVTEMDDQSPPESWTTAEKKATYTQEWVNMEVGISASAIYGDNCGNFSMPLPWWGVTTVWPETVYLPSPIHFQPGTAAMAFHCFNLGCSYGIPPLLPQPAPLFPMRYLQQVHTLPNASIVVATGMCVPCYSMVYV